MFRHFTKHLPGLYNFDYVERLKICKLESLELRRIISLIVKHRVRLDVRKYFYVNRVVNVWNCLNYNVVCSRTLHEFVHKLDSVDLSSSLKGRAHR